MKNYHVITVTFLAGLVIGCAVPAAKAHAESFVYGKTYTTVSVDAVEADECIITLDGIDYEFTDCSDADEFTEGDIVRLADYSGALSVINDGGFEAEISE